MAAQAPFDLGHEVFRKPQVIDGLLCLAAITCEALLRCAMATLSGFRVFFDISCRGGHGALLDSMGGFGDCSLPKCT